jgi:hypothetical protein
VPLTLYQFFTKEDKEEDESPELEQDHFEDICRMTTEFKRYMHDVYGADEAKRAATAKDRYDVDDAEE